MIVLIYPLYATAKPGQAFPYNYVTYLVFAWMLLGIGVYAYLKRTSPEKLTALGAAMASDEIDLAEAHSLSLSSEGLEDERDQRELR